MQIMATNRLPADKNNTCNGNLVVAITETITGNKILTENHLISLVDLFVLNPKQTKTKNLQKREMGPLSFLPPTDAQERKKKRGPRWRRGDNEDLGATWWQL